MSHKKMQLNQQLILFVENMPNAISLYDRKMRYLACSKKWRSDFKIGNQKIYGRSVYEVHPNIPLNWKKAHIEALNGNVQNADSDIFQIEEKEYWIKWQVRPWYINEKEIGGISIMSNFISDEKNEQEKIQKIFNAMNIGVWKFDPVSNQLEWDNIMYRLYGVKKENFSGAFDAWVRTLHPDYIDKAQKQFYQALKNKDQFHFKTSFGIITDEGIFKHIMTYAAIQRDSKGAAINVIGINLDKTSEYEGQKIKEYFEYALEGTSLGIWDWNLLDNSVKFDKRWTEMLGLDHDKIEMNLETWSSRVHPDDIDQCYKDIDDCLTGKVEQYQNIHRMRHADGHWVYILDQGKVSVHDDSGRPMRFTGTHLDITFQKKQEEDIKKAKEKAEQAERFKSEFLANMSHEIRSPMNGVLGMVDLLADTKLNHEQKMMLDTIRSSGETLLALLNDILDLSKIESTRLEIERITFNLNEIITTILGLFNPIATKKGVKLKFKGNLSKQSYYIGDALRIKQILTNLVSNAVKFTNEGEVSLSVKESLIEKNKSLLEFIIKDTGIGIAAEAKAKIFTAFSQADSSITRRYGGTGLGLVICKYLVELMGGEIYFESQEGYGTTFFIKLELEKVKIDTLKNKELDDNKDFSKLYPHKILLVEDNLVNQQVAILFLKKLGYDCDIAQNGKEALEKINSQDIGYYSIVFMDLQMPVLDGIKATEIIRKKYADNSPVIVAMTANAFKTDLDECMRKGMQGFLTKPVSLQKIKEVLKKFSIIKSSTQVDELNSFSQKITYQSPKIDSSDIISW